MHARPRKLLRQIFGDHGRAPRGGAGWIAVEETSMAHLSKRSVVIAGIETSISLENGFWSALKEIAHRDGVSVSVLINQIDAQRSHDSLTSAIRTFVLHDVRAHAVQQTVLPRPADLGHEEDCDTVN
jgi:predicted DNA-binding ribbon-helix-helix protein